MRATVMTVMDFLYPCILTEDYIICVTKHDGTKNGVVKNYIPLADWPQIRFLAGWHPQAAANNLYTIEVFKNTKYTFFLILGVR
jgi:hypothetical protein